MISSKGSIYTVILLILCYIISIDIGDIDMIHIETTYLKTGEKVVIASDRHFELLDQMWIEYKKELMTLNKKSQIVNRMKEIKRQNWRDC